MRRRRRDAAELGLKFMIEYGPPDREQAEAFAAGVCPLP